MKFFSRLFSGPQFSFGRYLKLGLVLLVLILGVGGAVGWQLWAPAGRPGSTVAFSIQSGESVKQIGAHLGEAHLIRNRFWFEAWVWLTGTERRFVAGEYHLPAQVNLVNLVRLLTGVAEPSNELTWRFIEGWTLKQVGEYLTAQKFTDGKTFARLATTSSRFSAIVLRSGLVGLQPGLSLPSLEGYLFPDTYRLYRGATSEDLILKMLTNFVQKFEPSWRAELQRRGVTVNQVVILASIVEREVQTDEDRALVADIFWRRLRAGWGLEADSTINYVTGKSDPSVSAKDLALNSPYNTYRYRGFPPGPISNPGVSALRATVYPRANAYWYFLTTSSGRVIYSKTYPEHIKAKQKYLH